MPKLALLIGAGITVISGLSASAYFIKKRSEKKLALKKTAQAETEEKAKETL